MVHRGYSWARSGSTPGMGWGAVQLILTYVTYCSLLIRGTVSLTFYIGVIAGHGLVVPQGWGGGSTVDTYIRHRLFSPH